MRPYLVLTLVTAMAAPALAVPQLQLDIVGGTYDPVTETIIAPSGESLTLVALLTPNGNPTDEELAALLAGTYFISAALVPAAESGEFGSFTFDETTVTGSDLTYGVPPLEAFLDHDSGDLPQHSIFETLFWQSPAFLFSATATAEAYDSKLNPSGLVESELGETYFRTFLIDTSLLAAGYQLHFDFYNTEVGTAKKNDSSDETDIDVDSFAPFSHDAETNRNGHDVAEPGTLLLFGAALLGFCVRRNRRNSA